MPCSQKPNVGKIATYVREDRFSHYKVMGFTTKIGYTIPTKETETTTFVIKPSNFYWLHQILPIYTCGFLPFLLLSYMKYIETRSPVNFVDTDSQRFY
jgi:hypothetical protein